MTQTTDHPDKFPKAPRSAAIPAVQRLADAIIAAWMPDCFLPRVAVVCELGGGTRPDNGMSVEVSAPARAVGFLIGKQFTAKTELEAVLRRAGKKYGLIVTVNLVGLPDGSDGSAV